MPQVNDDPRGREIFEFDGAGSDLARNRSKVRMPNLVESVGTDGRFIGAIRPFPGFADSSVHGIPAPTLTNIRLAKYVAIRKGLGDGILRGVVYLADNTQDVSLNGASSLFEWDPSTQLNHENSYFLRSKLHGARADARLPIPAGTVLVINGTPTSATGTFSLGTPLTAGQWGTAPAFINDKGDGKLDDDATLSTIYYRNSAGLSPQSLADDYLKIRLPGWAVYFSYWDSSTGTSATVELDNLRMLEGDPLGASLDEYDFACNGRYIYLVTGKRASRAYWYDFAFTAWQNTFVGISNRYMGVYSPDTLEGFSDLQVNSGRIQLGSTSSEHHDLIPRIPVGTYWGGLELISRKHGIRSMLAIDREVVKLANIHLNYVAIYTTMPWSPGGINGRWLSHSVRYWGLGQWDAIRIWRGLKQASDYSGVVTSDVNYGAYFLEAEVNASNNPFDNPSIVTYTGDAGANITDSLIFEHSTTPTWALFPFTSDQALAQSLNSYDPFMHEVGRVPESRRVVCLDGMTVVVAKPFVFANTELEWSYTGALSECLMYSSLAMGEVENFPTSNVWRPSQPGEVYHNLRVVGDYIAAIGSGGIHRLLQNGTELSGTTLVRGVGGVGRFSNASVGSSLFFVSRSGLKEVDMNTGSIRSMSAVDRMIFDERQWENSLAAIHMAYDATVGALILLNTTEKECIILWESSGAVTTLEDCPWSFLTEGPDAKTGGTQRAYFIQSNGKASCIDGGRDMSVKSMCGAGGGTDDVLVNGTVAASSTTTIINVTASGSNDIPDGLEGFRVYFRSGVNEGLSRWVSVRNGDLQFTVSEALPNAPATGDKISLAPIRFRVVCPQVMGTGGRPDSFERKKVNQIAPAFEAITGGEGDGTFKVGVYRRTTKLDGISVDYSVVPDKCWGQVGANGTQLYPYVESTMADLDFELQALLVRVGLTGSESESRQGS